MAERPVSYVAQRFLELESLAATWGWTIDAPLSRYDEEHLEDPLRGWLIFVAVHPLEMRDSDPEVDQPVRLKIEEWWQRADVGGADHVQGNALVKCHYAATAGRGHETRQLRYCYMPIEYPEVPMHWHPPDSPQDHRPHAVCSPSDAAAYFEQFVFEQLEANRIFEPERVPTTD
jgi:hypothetical protein